jgi:hypothetical protein
MEIGMRKSFLLIFFLNVAMVFGAAEQYFKQDCYFLADLYLRDNTNISLHIRLNQSAVTNFSFAESITNAVSFSNQIATIIFRTNYADSASLTNSYMLRAGTFPMTGPMILYADGTATNEAVNLQQMLVVSNFAASIAAASTNQVWSDALGEFMRVSG